MILSETGVMSEKAWQFLIGTRITKNRRLSRGMLYLQVVQGGFQRCYLRFSFIAFLLASLRLLLMGFRGSNISYVSSFSM